MHESQPSHHFRGWVDFGLGGGSGGGGRGDGSSGWALEWLSPTGDTLSQTYDHVRPVPEDQLNQLDQLDQLGSRQGL